MDKISLKELNLEMLSNIIAEFGCKQRIFHCEAQFQFELAWKLQEVVNCKVNLEALSVISIKKQGGKKKKNGQKSDLIKKMYTDILLEDKEDKDYRVAIELKYKTAELELTNPNVLLQQHGAVDLGRYDFLWDVNRLELLLNQNKEISDLPIDFRLSCNKAFAVLLTNDKHYWNVNYEVDSSGTKTIGDQFKIGDTTNVLCCSRLDWTRVNGEYPKTVKDDKSRARAIVLNKPYTYNWNDYCDLNVSSNGVFRYTIIEAVKLGSK